MSVKHILAAAIFSFSCLRFGAVWGLSLGDLTLESFLNEPLNAQVDLLNVGGLHEDQIRVRLATTEDFERIGVDRAYFLASITFDVEIDDNGRARIVITSENPVLEPYLDFIVEARWPSGRLLREYTVLVDPPVFDQSNPVISASSRVAEVDGVPDTTKKKPVASASTGTRVDVRDSNLAPGEMPNRAFNSTTSPSPVAGSRYMIHGDDTLWDIASTARPSGASVYQTMLDIQRLNPNAFIGGNINRVKAGYIVYLPDEKDISSGDRSQTLAEVREQNDAWRKSKALESDYSSGPSLRISAEPEDLEKAGPERIELEQRLSAMEQQAETLQRIVNLKGEQIAALQAALAAGETAADAASEPLAEEAPAVVAPAAAQSSAYEEESRSPGIFASLGGALNTVFDRFRVILDMEPPARSSSGEKDVSQPAARQLKYQAGVDPEPRDRFMCLDLSILYDASEDTPAAERLAPKVVAGMQEAMEGGRQLAVFPLFDTQYLRAADAEELDDNPWCSNTELINDHTPKMLLGLCESAKTDGFACSEARALVKYIGDDTLAKIAVTFVILDRSINRFVDAITVDYEIALDDAGREIVSAVPGEYKKLGNIAFPRKVNRHSLIVFRNERSYRFALVSRAEQEGELKFATWKTSVKNIDKIHAFDPTENFDHPDDLAAYGVVLRDAMLGEAKLDVIREMLDVASCDGSSNLEVVYPNFPLDQIKPLTIEYIRIEDKRQMFIGNCYLVSHRPDVNHRDASGVEQMHVYLAKKGLDGSLTEVSKTFRSLLATEGYEVLRPSCQGGTLHKPCIINEYLIRKPGEQAEVLWHETLPLQRTELHRSLVVFNAHQRGGKFYFDDRRPALFSKTLANISAPNYILNACGNPESKSINEMLINTEFRNLIFANRTISPKEAAQEMYCAVHSYLDIAYSGRGCLEMHHWMNNVRMCFGQTGRNEWYKSLAYHFIGQMDEVICPNSL